MGIGLFLVLAIIFGPPIIVILVLICQPPQYKTSAEINRRQYPLTWAVVNCNTDKATSLLSRGLHPDSEHSPQTPLRYAVANGNVSMVHLLLSYGADANDHINDEPYLFAAVDTLNVQLAELLLKNGANPNLHDKYGNSALYLIEARLTYSQNTDIEQLAAHKIKELLIEYGAK